MSYVAVRVLLFQESVWRTPSTRYTSCSALPWVVDRVCCVLFCFLWHVFGSDGSRFGLLLCVVFPCSIRSPLFCPGQEITRGWHLTKGIEKGITTWADLFQRSDFFWRFEMYIQVTNCFERGDFVCRAGSMMRVFVVRVDAFFL